MFDIGTAFRHFGCGGVIFERERPHRKIFKCAACWEWSHDLLDLVLEKRTGSEDGKDVGQEEGLEFDAG